MATLVYDLKIASALFYKIMVMENFENFEFKPF